MAVGSFTANRTSLQRREGIDDSLAAHIEDVSNFAQPAIESRNNEPLRRYFLSETAKTFEWLTAMGLTFQGPNPEPPNRLPRMHNVVPNANSYISILRNRLRALGGRIYTDATVKRIIRRDDRVEELDAEIKGELVRFRATRGIVLAAGDYSNSKSLIREHKGSEFAEIDGINPHSRGDGHHLVESVGGKLLNMDITWGPEIRFVPPKKKPFVQRLPGGGLVARAARILFRNRSGPLINAIVKRLIVTWKHPDVSLYTNGAVLINRNGRRFCNEKESPSREIALARQPDKCAFLLLDGRLIELYSKWPNFVSTAPEIAYAYVSDYLRLRPDISRSGADLMEIAESRDLPRENLLATIEAFNAYTRGEAPDEFGRVGDREPLKGEQWVILGPAKSYFTITEGGARINEKLEVLDAEGNSIDGLYAVGCNGLGGQILFGHGLHIAWAMTSGRLVGAVLGASQAQ